MGSKGDPRVLLAMNFVLSFVFATAVIGGLDFINVVVFEWTTVGVATLALVIVTYFVVLR